MPFRILVTGSSGFIGSALTTALVKAGHRVRGASRTSFGIEGPSDVEWVQLADLQNQVNWAPLLEGMDVVIHLAAIAHRSSIDGGQCERANRLATASLAQACLDYGIKRLIFMSSIGAQVGSAADHIVTELDRPRPVTVYDRTKLAAEEDIRKSGIPFTILRPVIVYGPGAKANIALIVRIAKLPLPLPFGGFKNRRSLLSIDNLVQAVIFCLEKPQTLNRTFIVCDNEPIALAEMFTVLRNAFGLNPRMISIPPWAVRAVFRAFGRMSFWDRIGKELVASSAALQKAGWVPKIDTKSGLRAMITAVKAPNRRW
jgi:nucleoside-diphosphate-sugar epimerase